MFSDCFASKNMLDMKSEIDKIDCIEISLILNMTWAFCIFLHNFKIIIFFFFH